MNHFRSKLTYSNVIATLALFLVLAGGSAFAASRLAKNSVGSKQLKANSVTSAKIKNGAVTGAKINLGTLGTVPSATNAAHATGADSAANATHATSAGTATEATKLNGLESATYLGRVAQALEFTPTASIPNSVATNLTPGGQLSITVPNGVQKVMAETAVSFAEPSAAVSTVLWIAESPETCAASTGLGFENRAFGSLSSTSPRDQVTQNVVFPVSPGVHSYLICVYGAGGTSSAFLRELTLQTVAGGPTG
ncbi:MAG: hypothetical protein JST08_17365 [Actinobacteria bacterium]|nr:hypothetical protein [Actinomycetota bacterium]